MKTLWEQFVDASLKSTSIPWRVYGNKSHKLICQDYGSLKDDDETIDNLKVVSCKKKNGYWRITIAE